MTIKSLCIGSSLAIVTARTRQPVMPSNYTILQYFASFIEDPLFENVSGESKYASAKTCFEKKVIIIYTRPGIRKSFIVSVSGIL